jgi:hypothetical protein
LFLQDVFNFYISAVSASAFFVFSSTWATAAIDANASPQNPWSDAEQILNIGNLGSGVPLKAYGHRFRSFLCHCRLPVTTIFRHHSPTV